MRWKAKPIVCCPNPRKGDIRNKDGFAIFPMKVAVVENSDKCVWVWLEKYIATQTYTWWKTMNEEGYFLLSWQTTHRFLPTHLRDM